MSPAQQQQVYNFANAPATNLPNGVETIAATSPKANSSYAGCTFAIRFSLVVLFGAAATGIIFRIRRDSVTGTVVWGPQTIAVVAAVTSPPFVVECADPIAGEVAGQIWVVTANVQGGAAAGTVNCTFANVTVAE